jgi:hypothetical protein
MAYINKAVTKLRRKIAWRDGNKIKNCWNCRDSKIQHDCITRATLELWRKNGNLARHTPVTAACERRVVHSIKYFK